MNYIENIKRIRNDKRVSQTDMAEKLGIAQNNYGRIERGLTELTVDRIYKIAEILGVSVLDILGEVGNSIENSEVEKLKKIIADLKSSMKVLENHNGLLINEVEEYESLIFDNNMEISGNNLMLSMFAAGELKFLMELFLEKEEDSKNGYSDYTANRINERFNLLMESEEWLPIIDLFLSSKKLLKSAIKQEDGTVNVALFKREYDELVKNYKTKPKAKL